MKLRSRLVLLVLTLSLVLTTFGTQAVAATLLSDLDGHWAENAVLSLVDQGVINGYPDGTFRPEKEVTRAEYAKILALAFDISPKPGTDFSDVKTDHWAANYINALAEDGIITGYPDGTFRPNNHITRAEAVTMVARVLDLLNNDETIPQWSQSFMDVGPDHWAFIPVELTSRLQVLPPQWSDRFQPKRNITRAEVAYMVFKATDFEVTKGTVSSIDTETNTIIVRPVVGNRQLFMLPSKTIILRNGSVTDLSKFMEGDQVHILSHKDGDTVYVKAMGILNQDDISNKVSSLVKGLLGPEQVKAIMKGDWEALGSSMKPRLYNELIELGATPEEAESLLAQDWQNMTQLGKERISAALSNALNVSPEMIAAVMSGNWREASDLAQLEITEKIIDALMF
ncbi:MAG: S-layer homology domain-containing protein [Firmicutes bacterium]|nr:S-layer homology domain-containing protein [Bacillota bacterium]